MLVTNKEKAKAVDCLIEDQDNSSDVQAVSNIYLLTAYNSKIHL